MNNQFGTIPEFLNFSFSEFTTFYSHFAYCNRVLLIWMQFSKTIKIRENASTYNSILQSLNCYRLNAERVKIFKLVLTYSISSSKLIIISPTNNRMSFAVKQNPFWLKIMVSKRRWVALNRSSYVTYGKAYENNATWKYYPKPDIILVICLDICKTMKSNFPKIQWPT